MLQVAMTHEQVEAALAAGELACPACSGPLSPWGYARSREARLAREVRSVTPRRALCQQCETTHVISPGAVTPGRQRARRRGGGDHAGRPRVGAAVRLLSERAVGAGGLPDRRTAARSATAAAVAVVPAVVPSGHDVPAIQLRTAAAGQAPRRRSTVNHALIGA